jgi:hypothetical protein
MEEFLNKLPTSVSKTELLRILQEFQDKYGILIMILFTNSVKKLEFNPVKSSE